MTSHSRPQRLTRSLFVTFLTLAACALVSSELGGGVSAVPPAPGCATVNLVPETDYDLDISVNSAVDLDGDGDLDLAASGLDGVVYVLFGAGDGTFGPKTNFGAGQLITTADFNNDGKLDLLTTSDPGVNVSVRLGSGNGAFGPNIVSDTGAFGSHTVGDFDGDGKPDLAVAGDGTVSVLLGAGDGTFGPKTDSGAGTHSVSAQTADFNLDGNLDLAAVLSFDDSDNVSLVLGNGDGTFGAATYFTVAFDAFSLTTGDFNLDGKPDLATVGGVFRVSVLIGNGNGTFDDAAFYHLGFSSYSMSIAVGDFNGDGKPDLVTANSASHNVSVLPGKGDGTFDARRDFDVGDIPSSVVPGDFDGNGMTDIAVNMSDGTVWILLSECPGAADLKLNVADAPDPVLIDDHITYTFNVENRGPLDATGVSVTDTLPFSLAFVSASAGCTHTGEPVGGTVTCAVGNLAAGSAIPDLNITAQAVSSGVITNTFNVSGNEFDDFLSNNTRRPMTNVITLRRVTISSSSASAGAEAVGGCSTVQTQTGTVLLTGRAPNGATILLESSDPSAASVPAGVTIAPNQLSATFSVTPGAVSFVTPVYITATLDTAVSDPRLSAPININPLRVKSLVLAQSTVQGGNSVTNNTVTLNCAPAANTPVALSSDLPNVAAMPSGFEVPAGSASHTFTITTNAVPRTRRVAVRATLNDTSKTAVLTVDP